MGELSWDDYAEANVDEEVKVPPCVDLQRRVFRLKPLVDRTLLLFSIS